MIHISNQLVGAMIGKTLILECESEAYPKSINFWMKGEHIVTTGKQLLLRIKQLFKENGLERFWGTPRVDLFFCEKLQSAKHFTVNPLEVNLE